MKKQKTDVAIIGFGTAGMRAYAGAKKHTDDIVVIEAGAYGTTCARSGCMPSKMLIAAANAANALDEAPSFGVYPGDKKIYGKQVMQSLRDLRDHFVGRVQGKVERIPAEKRIKGAARFTGPNTLVIGNEVEIEAKAIVIATGSRPRRIPQDKELGDRSIVNDDVFEWEKLPNAVAVFGTGVIGMELGQALQRLGVKTTVFGRSGNVTAFTDPALTELAKEIFHHELEVFPGADVHELTRVGDTVHAKFTSMKGVDYQETYDYVLSCIGRIPNVDGLDLKTTGIELDKRGLPLFDRKTMQCGKSSIFIAGDANNFIPLQHEAAIEGYIAGGNAATYPKVDPHTAKTPVGIVFTDPQIAMIGKSYGELEEGGFVIGKADFKEAGRARVNRKTKGLIHLYFSKQTSKLLGAEMIGPEVEHLSQILAWMMEYDSGIEELLAMPYYHPTLEEVIRSAVLSARSQLK
jgi:dihydrolipoamide dehydrogenase